VALAATTVLFGKHIDKLAAGEGVVDAVDQTRNELRVKVGFFF